MKKHYLLVGLLLVLLASCKKDAGPYSEAYVRGRVSFTLKNSVTLEQVNDELKFAAGGNPFELNNFCYDRLFDTDSLSYYANFFNTLPYVINVDLFGYPGEPYCQMRSISFSNLDYVEWDSITHAQHLVELPSGFHEILRRGVMYVPEGEEMFWVLKLKGLSVVNSAEIITISPD